MKKFLTFLVFFTALFCAGQNVITDSQSFSPQQLIEDILIDSDCITNVQVTNVIGGDFGGSDQSYGFFDANGSNFPFQSGLVLSTGRLQNVQGPNTFLSDDDAPNWLGDNDLEVLLDESGTTNATILEFDFTAVASQVSFRYIFASEEYQEGNPNTCRFSDLFGFLIRPANQTQYTNIALVPDTQIPVKVTTVHPDIPGGCDAQNEFYFESFNDTTAPINFNGQTKVLTATADIIPNESYHVKLVIADEQNFRFDSAVFLEAGGFQLSTDLGPDRLLSNNTALCENESLELDALLPDGPHTYTWFKDGVLVQNSPPNCMDCNLFTVSEPGTYTVEVELQGNCTAFGEVVIEYAENPQIQDISIIQCDTDSDGLTIYDLTAGWVQEEVTINNISLFISDYFLSQEDAELDQNPIANPESFQNTSANQIIYVRILNQNNCYSVAQITLEFTNMNFSIAPVEVCDDDLVDGFAEFALNDVRNTIQDLVPSNAVITFYVSEDDALSAINALPDSYENSTAYSDVIYATVITDNQCYALFPITLNVLFTPLLMEDEDVIYCLDSFPETIRLNGGVLNDSPSNYYYEWLFNGALTTINTSINDVNEIGTYTVIVTDPNGCSSQRDIIVSPSSIATIEDIAVQESGNNSTVTVLVNGSGDYEYALDNSSGPYQEEFTFTNVSAGIHTVFVRDRNGCGIVSEEFAVLGFPKFFTPNNDGFNETWRPQGANAQFNSDLIIRIFNRQGKLLVEMNSLSAGWDGTFNGNPLPTNDYWYSAEFLDGRTFNGHFTLKR